MVLTNKLVTKKGGTRYLQRVFQKIVSLELGRQRQRILPYYVFLKQRLHALEEGALAE